MAVCFNRRLLIVGISVIAGACGADRSPIATVTSSGKEVADLEAVPPEVLRAAQKARPELSLDAAEYEARNGQDYYDLAGKMPDGTELELDITTVDGDWTVVEIQRDVSIEQVPEQVEAAIASAMPDWRHNRIIESDQDDGTIIYEFFGPSADQAETKVEVKWKDGAAEVLQKEWLH
jgi:hypothetical protein